MTYHQLSESQRRLYEKLYNDLGKDLLSYLDDKTIYEIMVNPDGKCFVDVAGEGKIFQGEINLQKVFSIIHTVAGIHGFVVSQANPHVEAKLPHYKCLHGERFTASIPPVVSAPCFNIRKRAEKLFHLSDYQASGRLTQRQRDMLLALLKKRRNLLICGGPNSGKTTFTNALIVEAVKCHPEHRFVVLEDTPELQCTAVNQVSLLTTADISMTRLLKAAMRMSPDRILIGEVRGEEALTMLKAWNTGCPGGICTVHANGVEEALQRIADLALEAGLHKPPMSLISQTIDAIISLGMREHQKGFIQNIVTMSDIKQDKNFYEKLA